MGNTGDNSMNDEMEKYLVYFKEPDLSDVVDKYDFDIEYDYYIMDQMDYDEDSQILADAGLDRFRQLSENAQG